MSYPRDLDEFEDIELFQEIERRKDDRAKGLCDYCHRAYTTSACRFADRHRAPVLRAHDALLAARKPKP